MLLNDDEFEKVMLTSRGEGESKDQKTKELLKILSFL